MSRNIALGNNDRHRYTSLRGCAQRCVQRGEALWTFVDSDVPGFLARPSCIGAWVTDATYPE